MAEPLCPSIPSSAAAYRLVSPDASALPAVLGTLLGRALLIGAGLWIVRDQGEREHIVRDSLAAAAALEVFLLVYASVKTAQARRQQQGAA